MVMGYTFDKEVLFILGIPAYIIITGILIFIRKRKKQKIFIFRELLKLGFALYIMALIGVTLFPIEINFGGQPIHYGAGINYMPFKSIAEDVAQIGHGHFSTGFQIKLLLENVGGNFILLMPLAFMIPIIWRKMNSFKKVVIICFFVSLTIELLQFLECSLNLAIVRIVDIDDLILNTLGAAAGFFIYSLARWYVRTALWIKSDFMN